MSALGVPRCLAQLNRAAGSLRVKLTPSEKLKTRIAVHSARRTRGANDFSVLLSSRKFSSFSRALFNKQTESDNKPAGDNTPVGENKDNLPAEQSTTSPSQQSTTEQSVVDQTTSSQPVADKDGKVVEIVKPAGGEAEGELPPPSSSWQEEPDWPPYGNWPSTWLGFIAVMVAVFGYTFFALRDERFNDSVDFIRWGGEKDQLEHMGRVRRYLLYDLFGIEFSRKIAKMDFPEVVLDALANGTPAVREYASLVVREMSRHEATRAKLVELGALDVLRGQMSKTNLDVLYAIANLSEAPAMQRAIAQDELVVDSMLEYLHSAIQRFQIRDMYMIRAVMKTFYNVTATPENCQILAKYPHVAKAFGQLYPLDPVVMKNFVNTRVRLAVNCPEGFPDIAAEQREAGGLTEADRNLGQISFIHQSFLLLTAGVGIALYSARATAKKFFPLSAEEKGWLRSAKWRSPFVALGLALSWTGLEHITRWVGPTLFGDYEGRQSVRLANCIYFTQIPIYLFALRFAPYAFIPSFIWFKYRDDAPPNWIKILPAVDYVERELGLAAEYEELPTIEQLEEHAKLQLEQQKQLAAMREEWEAKEAASQKKSGWLWKSRLTSSITRKNKKPEIRNPNRK